MAEKHRKHNAAYAHTWSREKLDAEISQALYWSEHGGSSQGRREFTKKLITLEAVREERFGVPAKHRRATRK